MSLYRRAKGKVWHYEFQRQGLRFRGSTGCTDHAEARKKEDAAKAAVKAAGDGNARRQPMTWNAAAERFWQEKAQFEASAPTAEAQLANLVRLLGRDTPLHKTDDAKLAAFVAARRVEKSRRAPKDHKRACRCEACALSPASVNRELQLARRVMKRARKVWRTRLPADWPAFTDHLLPEPAGRVREATYAEEDAVLAKLRPDLHDVATAAAITGMRKRALIMLTWPQVDFGAGVLRYMAKSRKHPQGVPRILPLSAALRALLQRQVGHHPMRVFTYIAQRPRGSRDPALRRVKGQRYPLSLQGWQRQWRKALADAGVADFRWHDWRHTAGSRTLRATGNLRSTQELLGHADIASTVRYSHVMVDDVRNAMEAAARPVREVQPPAANQSGKE